LKDLQSKSKNVFAFEFSGPVELVDINEVNKIYPEGSEDVFIQFRRLKLSEMAEAANQDLDDMTLVKKIVSGWAGYTIDKKQVEYEPKYLGYLSYQDIDWILREAYGATTIQGIDMPDVTFHLRQITSVQRQALQQNSLKGFRRNKANQRMQQLLLQKIIIGWEGVSYKGKITPYKPELVELLPWSVVSKILEARPEDVNHEEEETVIKN
jgi:hypothetical protein